MKYTLSHIIVLVVLASGSPWQGAKMVWDSDTTDRPFAGEPILASDSSGTPWVLWDRFRISAPDSTMIHELSHWDGRGWAHPERLPDAVQHNSSYWDEVFAQDGKLWLVYPTHDGSDHCDIWSANYVPAFGIWGAPIQVNAPDTNLLDDYYPRIDVGGGQMWAVWFNEVGSQATSDIKASHWNDSTYSWGPEMTVNPNTGDTNRMEWFPDVAVDNGGTPHVVWTCSRPSENTSLRYSRYENGHWTAPESICNPDSFYVGGPYGGTRPRLVDDTSGNLHLAVLGAKPGDTVDGLYYFRRTAGKWGEPVRTDTWSTTGKPIWDKDIAVAGPDDIWVTFDRGNGSDWMVFAQHSDGQLWTPEERIDDGWTYEGGFPKITLDGKGLPFVAWAADGTRTGYKSEIWYNTLAVSGQSEPQRDLASVARLGATVVRGVLVLPGASGHRTQAAGLLDISGRTIRQLHAGANDVHALAPGVYFVCDDPESSSHNQQAIRKVVLTR